VVDVESLRALAEDFLGGKVGGGILHDALEEAGWPFKAGTKEGYGEAWLCCVDFGFSYLAQY